MPSTYVKKNGVATRLVGIPKGWNVVNTFNVASTAWVANSDSTTSSTYPYVATISTTYFTNDSQPIWQMNGVGTLPTDTEREAINLVMEAIFTSTGVTLYATDQPTVNLVLETGGFSTSYSSSQTELSSTVAAGSTAVTFTDPAITPNSKIMLFFDDVFIPYTGVTTGSGTVTYEFDALASTATATLWIVD